MRVAISAMFASAVLQSHLTYPRAMVVLAWWGVQSYVTVPSDRTSIGSRSELDRRDAQHYGLGDMI